MNTDRILVQQPNKLLGLELIRFISAFSVLVWHYQLFSYVADKPAGFLRKNQPFYSFLELFYNYGLLGVHVFWCVSGFIFFWKYRIAIAENTISAKTFFDLRFSRLYPLHFFTLLIVAALQAIYFAQKEYFFVHQSNDLFHFILQLFLASNWGFENGHSFNGPIWSISVEILVYFIFFLGLRYIGKSYWLNIAILLFCLSTKLLNITSLIIDCLAYFYIGGLAAIALRHFEKSAFKIPLFIISFVVITGFPYIVMTTQIHQHKYFMILWMAYIPILLFACAQNIKAPPSIQKVIEAAGNMTYSSYLIHFPIQLLIALYFLQRNQPIPYYEDKFFIFFMLTTLTASYFIYHLFELPVQNFLRSKSIKPTPQQNSA